MAAHTVSQTVAQTHFVENRCHLFVHAGQGAGWYWQTLACGAILETHQIRST